MESRFDLKNIMKNKLFIVITLTLFQYGLTKIQTVGIKQRLQKPVRRKDEEDSPVTTKDEIYSGLFLGDFPFPAFLKVNE